MLRILTSAYRELRLLLETPLMTKLIKRHTAVIQDVLGLVTLLFNPTLKSALYPVT
jgi:hypothetical protein